MRKKLLSIITLLLIFSMGFAFNMAYAKKLNAAPAITSEKSSTNWQAISRLTYVSGTIISYNNSASEGPVIKIKVDTCYHSGTDPVTAADYPFKPGEEKSFLLIKHPEINLQTGQKVILYEGQEGRNSTEGLPRYVIMRNIEGRVSNTDSAFYIINPDFSASLDIFTAA